MTVSKSYSSANSSGSSPRVNDISKRLLEEPFRLPPQETPPRSPRETLPTMYDLPSEYPEEPGLADEFHILQPSLLSATLHLPDYTNNHFVGTDLNIYYDVRHPMWHKRPDWFLSVGVPRLYDGHDMRRSYVIWQEGVTPLIAVELISPGTEKEDLGETVSTAGSPPTKWDVYEKVLRIPYYIVLDRYTDRLRAFHLQADEYQPLPLEISSRATESAMSLASAPFIR
ncbi:MAG: Uma2 family endonuclease [Cyanobacteria bacterium J06649_4]